MFYYLLIILSAIGIAANFALTKGYLIIHGNTLKAGTIFNCLVGLSGSIIYFFVCDFKIEITWFSAILAFLFTLFVGFYTIIGFKIMSMGNMAVYTVFLMLGGMILPYFYGQGGRISIRLNLCVQNLHRIKQKNTNFRISA